MAEPDEWQNGNHTNCGSYLSSPSVACAVVFVVFILVAAVACMQKRQTGEGQGNEQEQEQEQEHAKYMFAAPLAFLLLVERQT